jgi:hypothetical protein
MWWSLNQSDAAMWDPLSQTPLLLMWSHVIKSQPIRYSHVRQWLGREQMDPFSGQRGSFWRVAEMHLGIQGSVWQLQIFIHELSCGHLWGCPHRGVWSLIGSLWVLGLISVSVEDFVSYLSSSTPFLVFLIHLVLIQLFVTKNHSLKSNEFILCLKS